MDRAELKRRARAQLGGKIFGSTWLYAVLVMLIFGAVGYAINLLPMVGWLVMLLIMGPLSYGVSYLFLKQARDGEAMQMGDLLKGFREDLSGTFLLGLMTDLFTVLWGLLLVIPGIIAQMSYAMVFYIKIDHPEYDWNECIQASKQMMMGHKAEFFVLELSFIGWYIVGGLCLGVGSLWVAAYQNAAEAQFYEQLKTGC